MHWTLNYSSAVTRSQAYAIDLTNIIIRTPARCLSAVFVINEMKTDIWLWSPNWNGFFWIKLVPTFP